MVQRRSVRYSIRIAYLQVWLKVAGSPPSVWNSDCFGGSAALISSAARLCLSAAVNSLGRVSCSGGFIAFKVQ